MPNDKQKYRLYIDEVGHSGFDNIGEKSRYLSLTGVICGLDEVNSSIHPHLEMLKCQYFPAHNVDEPVVFHRKEILQKKGPFYPLIDEETNQLFDNDLLQFLSKTCFTAITVSIDKLEQKERYTKWLKDPYHYCLEVLLERYRYFLEKLDSVGDVLAESRGGKEDKRLKDEYSKLYNNGTGWIAAKDFQKVLTSKNIKIKTKQHNIAGLQLADLIAHPSFIYSRCIKNKEKMPNTYGGKVVDILKKDKYLNLNGKTLGWGIKWLP